MMLKRGLALCFVLAFSAATYGQAEIINVNMLAGGNPLHGQSFGAGTSVNVDVVLSQSGTGSTTAKSLRYVQFDLNAAVNSWIGSDGNVSLPQTHSAASIDGWNFTTPTTSGCPTAANAACGANQYLEDIFPGGPRPKVLAAAFTGLVANAAQQMQLPASAGTVTVLKLVITMPLTNGPYTLNLVNASDTNPDRGAEVRWGFGSGAPDPLVKKRAQDGGITGGVATFNVGPTTCQNFQTSVPTHVAVAGGYSAPFPTGNSLWRQSRNTIRMTFENTLASAPAAGQIQIREILAGAGNFGPNLNTGANFTFTLENGPNGVNSVLRVREATPAVLANRKWYAISNVNATGWGAGCNFEAHYVTQVGDFDANNFLNSGDVLNINAAPNAAQPDQSRLDVDGNGFKNNADVLLANSLVSGARPPKPAGH